MSDHESDRQFRNGQYDDAIASLKKGLEEQGENGRDRLLYLLDLGLALHTRGLYEESNKVLLEADKIAEIKDYTSLAAEGATLLTSENIKDYKGEDFEKVLINTYLAMNYALIGDYENGLVEARVVNRKLRLMVEDGQRKYKQNAFARYLSGVLYEAEREYGDAYIDYKETRKLMPELPGLGRDLYRLAMLQGMGEEMERWKEEYGLTEEDIAAAKALAPRAKRAEIIVLYENGISPVKRPHPDWYSIPKFYPRYNPVLYAEVEVDGARRGGTMKLHDIEWTAMENLNEKWGGMIAKKIAGVVAKEVVGKQVENMTDSPLLGFATKMFFYVSDQADLRSWNLLPRDLQIARMVVDPGVHTVKVYASGTDLLGEKTVQVEAGKKAFVNFRYIPR
jgi:hypothetical protein